MIRFEDFCWNFKVMDSEKTTDAFFVELLRKTKKQFEESPIYKRQNQEGKKWGYAVCDTPIVRGKGIIFGINWGGVGDYSPQTEMPDGFEISQYHFIRRSKGFLEKGWGLDFSSVNFNYTNLCFFRSPKASDLTLEDFRLSFPLFQEYVAYIRPPWLLSIGGTNIKILNQLGQLENVRTFEDQENKFKGYSAELWGFKVYSVPHPSARMKKVSRQTIWEKVTAEIIRI
jgi:hypothetical protein